MSTRSYTIILKSIVILSFHLQCDPLLECSTENPCFFRCFGLIYLVLVTLVCLLIVWLIICLVNGFTVDISTFNICFCIRISSSINVVLL